MDDDEDVDDFLGRLHGAGASITVSPPRLVPSPGHPASAASSFTIAQYIDIALDSCQCPFADSSSDAAAWRACCVTSIAGGLALTDEAHPPLQAAMSQRAAVVEAWNAFLPQVLDFCNDISRATLLQRLLTLHAVETLGAVAPKALGWRPRDASAAGASLGAVGGGAEQMFTAPEVPRSWLGALLPLGPSEAPSLSSRALVAAFAAVWAAATADPSSVDSSINSSSDGLALSAVLQLTGTTPAEVAVQRGLRQWVGGAGHARALLNVTEAVLLPLLHSRQAVAWGLETAPLDTSAEETVLPVLTSLLTRVLACLCALEEGVQRGLAKAVGHVWSGGSGGEAGDVRLAGLILAAAHPVWSRVLPAVRLPCLAEAAEAAAKSSSGGSGDSKGALQELNVADALLELFGRPWHIALVSLLLVQRASGAAASSGGSGGAAATAGGANRGAASPAREGHRKSLGGGVPRGAQGSDTAALRAIRATHAVPPAVTVCPPFGASEELGWGHAARLVAWMLMQHAREARQEAESGPWSWGDHGTGPLPYPDAAALPRLLDCWLAAHDCVAGSLPSEVVVPRLTQLRTDFLALLRLDTPVSVPAPVLYITAASGKQPYPAAALLPGPRLPCPDAVTQLAALKAAWTKKAASKKRRKGDEIAAVTHPDVAIFFEQPGDTDDEEDSGDDDVSGAGSSNSACAGAALDASFDSMGLPSVTSPRLWHKTQQHSGSEDDESDSSTDSATESSKTRRLKALQRLLARVPPEALACFPGAERVTALPAGKTFGDALALLASAALLTPPLGRATPPAERLRPATDQLIDLLAGDALLASWAPVAYDRLPRMGFLPALELPPPVLRQVLHGGLGVPTRFKPLATVRCCCVEKAEKIRNRGTGSSSSSSSDDEEEEEPACLVHDRVPATWVQPRTKLLHDVAVYTPGALADEWREEEQVKGRKSTDALKELAFADACATVCYYSTFVQAEGVAASQSSRAAAPSEAAAPAAPATAKRRAKEDSEAWAAVEAARFPLARSKAATTAEAKDTDTKTADVSAATAQKPRASQGAVGTAGAAAAPGKRGRQSEGGSTAAAEALPPLLVLQPGAVIEVLYEASRTVRVVVKVEPTQAAGAGAAARGVLKPAAALVHTAWWAVNPASGNMSLSTESICATEWEGVAALLQNDAPPAAPVAGGLPSVAAQRPSAESSAWQPLFVIDSPGGAPAFDPPVRGPANWKELPPAPAWPAWDAIPSRGAAPAPLPAPAKIKGKKSAVPAPVTTALSAIAASRWGSFTPVCQVVFAASACGVWQAGPLITSHLAPLKAWKKLCSTVTDDVEVAAQAARWDALPPPLPPSASLEAQQVYAAAVASRGYPPERMATVSEVEYKEWMQQLGRLLSFGAFHACSDVFKTNLAEAVAPYGGQPLPPPQEQPQKTDRKTGGTTAAPALAPAVADKSKGRGSGAAAEPAPPPPPASSAGTKRAAAEALPGPAAKKPALAPPLPPTGRRR